MSAARSVLAYTAAAAALLAGYGFWRGLAPGEQRNQELLKHFPESNPAVLEESRRRNALMMERLKEASQTNENITRTYGTAK